jgi:hypothetical protein
MLTPSLPHACFFHFSDTCSFGSNGSTKFLKSMLSLIPFWRAGPALVLECYDKYDVKYRAGIILHATVVKHQFP